MACISADALHCERIDGSEPAHRSVRHERLMYGFPSVSFHLDDDIGLSCQLTVCLAECGDEQVVDVGVVGMVSGGEQPADGFPT